MLLLLLPAAHAQDTPSPNTYGAYLPSGLQAIDQVQYLLSDSPQPPPATADWRTTTLPFSNRTLEPSEFTTASAPEQVWFRFLLDRPADGEHYSLYLWRLNLHARVYFNGAQIAASTHRPGRYTMSWNHPLLADIQPGSWQAGGNEVMIALTRTDWGGTLPPVLFGPSGQLRTLWQERMFRQVEINEVLLAFGLGLAAITFFIWLLRRQDTLYLWFSGIALGWSVLTSHLVIYYNPVPYSLWLPLVHASIDFCTFCMYGFLGRLVAVRRPFRERLLLGWTLLASVTYFLVPASYFWYVAYAAHLVGIIALGVIVFRVALLAFRTRQRDAILIAGAMCLQIILFIQNAALMFFADAARWESGMFYAHFGIPVLLLIFSMALLMRFIRALASVEDINRNLEEKVEQSRRIIERSFAERRALELEQAAERERLKIYRDLHDDVGSQLLSIIHADRDSRLGSLARKALESLRQAVSRANMQDQPFDRFIADLAEESRLRLEGSGHSFSWQQPEEIPEDIIAAGLAFNLNRIMKELVSNIIRHAGASEVRMALKRGSSFWLLVVSDDGKGFHPDQAGGNGLSNIRSRAAEIGAVLTMNSGAEGTTTSIRWSAEAAGSADASSGGSPACELATHAADNPDYTGLPGTTEQHRS